MKALIRVDANSLIGAGHLMRCEALGLRLQGCGFIVHFVCNILPLSFEERLINNGFLVSIISVNDIVNSSADAYATSLIASRLGFLDLLILDHYGLGFAWEQSMRKYARQIFVIDDLINRRHDCDFLLDQNLHKDAVNRYRKYVPLHTKLFLGPQYSLLRNEFDVKGLARERDGSVKSLLIYLGSDAEDTLLKIIKALKLFDSIGLSTKIVLGSIHQRPKLIHGMTKDLPGISILSKSDQMSRLIFEADLAIGTCGISAWERCVLGLPALVVITAENQREDAEILHELGAVENLGNACDVSVDKWAHKLNLALGDPNRIREMAIKAKSIMSGRNDSMTQLVGALLNGA